MWEVVLGRAISGAGSSALGVVAALLISGTLTDSTHEINKVPL